MSITKKLLKNTTIQFSSELESSKFFNDKDVVSTAVPMINVALSGDLTGGMTPGLTMIAGPSKHFKTCFSLILAKAYLDKYQDAAVLFYDSEFGTPQSYFEKFGIDTNRVVHTPITDIEQLKHDVVTQLKNIERGDKVFIFIDSIGNLASRKEIEDAEEGKSVADMTRAKQIKSLFRMVTPHLTMKDIPMVVVNHTYKEMCLAGDTRIKTEFGIKSIRDIVVGDRVYALNGLQKVSATMGPDVLVPVNKKFLELEFDDGSIVRCTHDHKFLIENDVWTEAINLKIGQKMR